MSANQRSSRGASGRVKQNPRYERPKVISLKAVPLLFPESGNSSASGWLFSVIIFVRQWPNILASLLAYRLLPSRSFKSCLKSEIEVVDNWSEKQLTSTSSTVSKSLLHHQNGLRDTEFKRWGESALVKYLRSFHMSLEIGR
jgi:hypothetical protein